MTDSTTSDHGRRAAGDDLMDALRFGVPPATGLHVPRPHLTALLDRAHHYPLVLVSAPAGTGKTAAVADWVRAGQAGDALWITFEEGETAFWPSVLESLRRHGLGVPASWGATVGGRLGSQRLSTLTRIVVGASERLIIVIDGYELAALELAHEVDYLIRHSLGRLCIVFVGRVDPVLPLYQYRLTSSLFEIRAPELAMSDTEAARLLRQAGVPLEDSAVHQLNQRVSGWVAGLRFAIRALADKDDPGADLVTVLDQTTDINEYLVGEVLDAQAPEVRRFLLDTSVTDVFSAELAHAIGGTSAVRAIHDLARRRVFLEPVTGLPGWFRYYPFFRSFLQAQLAHEAPERMAQAGRAAARWLREQGHKAQSVAQLATVGAWEEMADQIVDDALVGRLLFEEVGGTFSMLARRVPPDVATPAAYAVRAAIALHEGDRQRCSRELTAARRTDPGRSRSLALAVAVTEALLGCFTEQPGAASASAERAARLLDELAVTSAVQSTELDAAVAFARGVSALRLGQVVRAGNAFEQAVSSAGAGISTAFRAQCLGFLALTDALLGRLSQASRHAESSFVVAGQAGLAAVMAPASAHLALAWVGIERADTNLVREHVALARASRTLRGQPVCQGLVEAATAAVERSEGRSASALVRLTSAADTAAEVDPWVADLLRVEAARLTVGSGRPEDALRLLAAAFHPDRAEVAVTAEAAYAEQGSSRPVGRLEEIVGHEETSRSAQVRALLAEAVQASRQRSLRQAGPALSRALQLAEAEHMRNPFRDAGPSARRVMAAHPRLLGEHTWLDPEGLRPVSARTRATRSPDLPVVVEPLTPKELEVLGHVAELLTTEEIAQKMFVSVNTIRTHIRNILRKLGVNRRNAAIRRARELGLLETGAAIIPSG